MDFYKFFEENFSKRNYEQYMVTWLNGIINEIEFWDDYFETEGSEWKDGYKKMIEYERQFTLEQYIDSDSTVFLDVGSGPLSSCGSRTEKTKMEFYAVDPLAAVYKVIKKKYRVRTKIQPEFAMVEKLSEKYSQNTFDIVHMQNALDHSFNPIMGLLQMIYVCKIGGKIILCHRDNEAEYEKYTGFHQWNLLVQDELFLIWRDRKRFDVYDLFKEYIDLKVIPAKNEVELHKVIITKRKNIELVNDSLLEIYHRRIFNKLLECFLEKISMDKKEKKKLKYRMCRIFEKLKRFK